MALFVYSFVSFSICAVHTVYFRFSSIPSPELLIWIYFFHAKQNGILVQNKNKLNSSMFVMRIHRTINTDTCAYIRVLFIPPLRLLLYIWLYTAVVHAPFVFIYSQVWWMHLYLYAWCASTLCVTCVRYRMQCMIFGSIQFTFMHTGIEHTHMSICMVEHNIFKWYDVCCPR